MESFVFNPMSYKPASDEAWPFPRDEWDPDLGASLYQEYVDQLVTAERLGFDGIGFTEHHFSAFGLQPSPNLLASYVAERTEDITLAFFGNLPAIRENPIRLAEEIAMLDNITKGRLISGFPRGIPTEYAAYDIDMDTSRGRFEEAWDLILKTWTEDEPFDFEGEYYEYENVYAWPRPYQQPHPPLWMPAGSERSLQFAASRQVPIGRTYATVETIADTFQRYREIAETEGWHPREGDFTIARLVYVAESAEQAREEAEAAFRTHYETLLSGAYVGGAAYLMGDGAYDPSHRAQYVENLPPHAQLSQEFDWDHYRASGEIIAGSPQEVIAEIERQYEAVGGFGRLAGTFSFGDLPAERAERSMQRYAEEVMPALDRLG